MMYDCDLECVEYVFGLFDSDEWWVFECVLDEDVVLRYFVSVWEVCFFLLGEVVIGM